jgi:hypothetical protein
MTSTADLIALLDILAKDFAESTSARTTLGIAVRARGKAWPLRIVKSESERDAEIQCLKLLFGSREKEGIVWTHDENRRAALGALVEAGGEPFGFIRLTYDGATLTVYSTPFNEFIDDPTARIALTRICRLDPQRLLDCITSGREVENVRYFEKPSATGPAICQ